MKKYLSNTYNRCYCAKNAEVSVGSKPFALLNIVGIPLALLLCLWIATTSIALLDKLIIIALIGSPITILPRIDYVRARQYMLQAGHTESCSSKIALSVMIHGGSVDGLFSDLKIVKKEEKNGKVSSLKKSGNKT